MKKMTRIVTMLLAVILVFSCLVLAETAITDTATPTNVSDTDVTGTAVTDTTVTPTTPTDSDAKRSLGDLNCDGIVDAKDALFILKLTVGKVELPEEELVYANLYADDVIDARDALIALRVAVGKLAVEDLPVLPEGVTTPTDVTPTIVTVTNADA